MDINSLTRAVVNEDINMLVKLPGIGKKTAQRIILDIKEKLIKKGNYDSQKTPEGRFIDKDKEKLSVVFDTLEALGYSNKEILNIIPELEKNQDLPNKI
jgi:Holliday junction DNA helicase RuvA